MLGFILFGWPKRTKTKGVATAAYCHYCDNETWFSYVKERRWASLFFIPLLPLGTADAYLVCNVCRAGIELDDDQIDAAKEMLETTAKFHSGEMTESAYFDHTTEFAETIHTAGADSDTVDEQPEEHLTPDRGFE